MMLDVSCKLLTVVFAGLNLFLFEVLKRAVRIEYMQLFLVDDCIQRIKHVIVTLPKIISGDFVCDVVDKLREEGNFEQLVQCNQLEVSDSLCTEPRRWGTVR